MASTSGSASSSEVHPEYVVLSNDSLIRTHTVVWVTGVTGTPLIEELGLPTEKGRLKVQTDLQVPGHPDVFSAGDAEAVPDVTQPGKITPPTAQHATRQGRCWRTTSPPASATARRNLMGIDRRVHDGVCPG